jgi:hypothetical protein
MTVASVQEFRVADPATRETAWAGPVRRLRVIYADLSEFHGTTADWDEVRDGILIVQIEERAGYWATLHGHDWYCVCSCGDHACGDTDRLACNIASDSSRMSPERLPRHGRTGKLVPNDVWQRAKTRMHQLPNGCDDQRVEEQGRH